MKSYKAITLFNGMYASFVYHQTCDVSAYVHCPLSILQFAMATHLPMLYTSFINIFYFKPFSHVQYVHSNVSNSDVHVCCFRVYNYYGLSCRHFYHH